MPTIAIALQASQTKQSYVEDWRLLETYRGDQHIVGRFSDTGRYWATPPIIRLDFACQKGFTSDGRQYVLVERLQPSTSSRYVRCLMSASRVSSP